MTCTPERVTGYVDGVLDPAEKLEVEAHLAVCPECSQQAASERELRQRLRGLGSPEPRPSLEGDVRHRLRRGSHPWARVLLPLAASLVLLALWVRGLAPFVAWELARDHAHCFASHRLPAEVWSDDPQRIAAWFEEHGTHLPLIPTRVDGLDLVGGRYCPLPDASRAAHIYYSGEGGHLSLFVLAHAVRLDGAYSGAPRGHAVHLLRLGDAAVGLVSEDRGNVETFRRALATNVAFAAPSN